MTAAARAIIFTWISPCFCCAGISRFLVASPPAHCSRISDSHRPGRPLAIRPTQGFHCPLDGRVCSGNRCRLLGNEPVSHGDLRTQNGILRQVTLVMHCQSPPIAVETPHTFASRSPCKGRGRIGCACRISGTGLPIPACSREKIFLLGRAGNEDLAP